MKKKSNYTACKSALKKHKPKKKTHHQIPTEGCILQHESEMAITALDVKFYMIFIAAQLLKVFRPHIY